VMPTPIKIIKKLMYPVADFSVFLHMDYNNEPVKIEYNRHDNKGNIIKTQTFYTLTNFFE